MPSFIKEKFNPKEGFPARFIAENIGAIHNLELRKNEYKNRALAFVEKEIIDEKREASKQEAVRYAKEIFGGFMSSNADIKYETKLNEIILEGDSLIAQGIKLAETAVAGADLGVSKIEEVYYDISEGTSSEILRRVPDAAGYLDRLTTAKSRRAEAKSKVRAKKGILSGLWAAIVGGFGTNG
jgi:hypothetical protein